MSKKTFKVESYGCSGGNSQEITIPNKEEQVRRELRDHYKNTAKGEPI